MVGFLSRRLASLGVTLVLVTVIAFSLVELMPGDPAAVAAGEFATPEAVERTRDALHLDQPVLDRYVSFIGDALHGDLGTSVQVQPGASVSGLVREAVPATASMTFMAIVLAILIALPVGYVAAIGRGSWIDRVVTAFASVTMAVPPFVLGLVLASLLAVNRTWLPAIGYVSIADGGIGEWFRHIVLPSLTLAAVPAAELARQVRGSLVDAFEQDYVRTAVAKGLRRRRVIAKHAFKNAATPIVTVLGLQLARIVGGSVVVERIYAISGFGSLSVNAVLRRDLPLIQGIVLTAAIIVIAVNLLVDLTHGYLNPKSRR